MRKIVRIISRSYKKKNKNYIKVPVTKFWNSASLKPIWVKAESNLCKIEKSGKNCFIPHTYHSGVFKQNNINTLEFIKKTLKNMTSFFQTRHSIELLTTASEPMNISLYYWNCYLLVKWKVFYDQNKTILMPFSTFIGLAS